MKKKFLKLIKTKLFNEACWMHFYHLNIMNKKIDKKNCPICAADNKIDFIVKEKI